MGNITSMDMRGGGELLRRQMRVDEEANGFQEDERWGIDTIDRGGIERNCTDEMVA